MIYQWSFLSSFDRINSFFSRSVSHTDDQYIDNISQYYQYYWSYYPTLMLLLGLNLDESLGGFTYRQKHISCQKYAFVLISDTLLSLFKIQHEENAI